MLCFFPARSYPWLASFHVSAALSAVTSRPLYCKWHDFKFCPAPCRKQRVGPMASIPVLAKSMPSCVKSARNRKCVASQKHFVMKNAPASATSDLTFKYLIRFLTTNTRRNRNGVPVSPPGVRRQSVCRRSDRSKTRLISDRPGHFVKVLFRFSPLRKKSDEYPDRRKRSRYIYSST